MRIIFYAAAALFALEATGSKLQQLEEDYQKSDPLMRMNLSEVSATDDPVTIGKSKFAAAKAKRQSDHANNMNDLERLINKAGNKDATLNCAKEAIEAYEGKKKALKKEEQA